MFSEEFDIYLESFSENYEVITEGVISTVINAIASALRNIKEMIGRLKDWIVEKFNNAFKKDEALLNAVDNQIKADSGALPSNPSTSSTSSTTIAKTTTSSTTKAAEKSAEKAPKNDEKPAEETPAATVTKNNYEEISVSWVFATEESRNKAFEWMPTFNKTIGAVPQDKLDMSNEEIGKAVRGIYFVKEAADINASEVGGLKGIKEKYNSIRNASKTMRKQLDLIERQVDIALKEYQDKATKVGNIPEKSESDAGREERYKSTVEHCTNYKTLFSKFSPKYYGCYITEYKCYKAAMAKCVAAGKTKNESVINKCVLTALYEADMCFA